MYGFLLNPDRTPTDMVHPAEARKLLRQGRAAVLKPYPFTLILKQETRPPSRRYRLGIDPGSKTTGFALVDQDTGQVVWGMELEHRGKAIKEAMDTRRMYRRRRRCANLRHRAPRFDHRTKKKGYLPPSLEHRVRTITTWARRLLSLARIDLVTCETNKFDSQALMNPGISGVEYQQGTLQGYEVREYLLERYNRRCCYCRAKDVPLQVEHVIPRSRGGTNSITNLVLACRKCNVAKGNKTAAEFGHAKVAKPVRLKDSAVITSIRFRLIKDLKALGVNIQFCFGSRTKMNRIQAGLPKEHWIDAACTGESGNRVRGDSIRDVLEIKCTGHGRRRRENRDKYGKAVSLKVRKKRCEHVGTNDIVLGYQPRKKRSVVGRASIDHGKKVVKLSTKNGQVAVTIANCRVLQKADGYQYGFRRYERSVDG